MDRADLLELLDRYQERHPDEVATTERIRRLIVEVEGCFHRDCFPGHITSSAWIVSRENGAALLTNHRKLGRWLQLGGHADGETDVLASARREAEEESGMQDFEPLPLAGQCEILDLDVHDIPARGEEPLHQHHDIRFLLEVSDQQPISCQEAESKEVRWFSPDEIAVHIDEESLARMARKASEWLSQRRPGSTGRGSRPSGD